jgi:hypothetical protein
MIGERIESVGGAPWEGLTLLAAGLVLAAAGWFSGISAMVAGAALPIALGGSWWFLGQERPLTATFREDGLEVETAGEPVLVPYASIRNLKVGRRAADPATFDKPSAALTIVHDGGVLRIPSRLNLPSHEVLRFLADRVPRTGGRDVNPVLLDYLNREEQYYGPSSVASFRAASCLVSGPRTGYRALALGLMLAGTAWTAYGFSGRGDTAWGVFGVIGLVFGVLFLAASFAENRPSGAALKNWKDASLVIGPHGMAMVQGHLQGEVRWPELLEIRFQAKPGAVQFGYQFAIPGILLRVKGAKILIADIYDRPLFVIHERILASSGRSTPPDVE